jgi:hypothetical protein
MHLHYIINLRLMQQIKTNSTQFLRNMTKYLMENDHFGEQKGNIILKTWEWTQKQYYDCVNWL